VPSSPLASQQAEIDACFAGDSLSDILTVLKATDSEFAAKTLKVLGRVSPLSAGCTIELVHRARLSDDIKKALEQEFRFTYRSMDQGDFMEGVRAQIIDKDRNPTWKPRQIDAVPSLEVTQMLMPLGADALKI
jgi:enoyl-CoA hydratase